MASMFGVHRPQEQGVADPFKAAQAAIFAAQNPEQAAQIFGAKGVQPPTPEQLVIPPQQEQPSSIPFPSQGNPNQDLKQFIQQNLAPAQEAPVLAPPSLPMQSPGIPPQSSMFGIQREVGPKVIDPFKAINSPTKIKLPTQFGNTGGGPQQSNPSEVVSLPKPPPVSKPAEVQPTKKQVNTSKKPSSFSVNTSKEKQVKKKKSGNPFAGIKTPKGKPSNTLRASGAPIVQGRASREGNSSKLMETLLAQLLQNTNIPPTFKAFL